MFLKTRRCQKLADRDTSTIADLYIWQAANLLIKRHGGPDAAIIAAQRADGCLASGDVVVAQRFSWAGAGTLPR